MKKLLYLLIALMGISLTACNSDKNDIPEVKKPIGKLDPSAFVRIEAEKGVKVRATDDQYTEDGERLYTAFEVAKYGAALKPTGKRFGDQRDTLSQNPALLMFGTDIITMDGELHRTFIDARDNVIVQFSLDGKPLTYDDIMAILDDRIYRVKEDTIAYIPNSVMDEATKKIEEAYNDSNYTEVYRLFNEAFTFKPITAKQWKRLKALGKQ